MESIELLKKRLSETPILKFPDFKKGFILHTDASGTVIGACLMQLYGEQLHPLIYVCKCLNLAQRKYSTTKREALALVDALDQFRHLIWGYTVHVYTDHYALMGIIEKKLRMLA